MYFHVNSDWQCSLLLVTNVMSINNKLVPGDLSPPKAIQLEMHLYEVMIIHYLLMNVNKIYENKLHPHDSIKDFKLVHEPCC